MTPDSVEARMARLQAEVAAAQRAVDMFGPTAGQVIENSVRLSGAIKDLEDFKSWIADVEHRLGKRIDDVAGELHGIREDFKEYEDARADARVRISIAVIAGSFTTLAAIVAALATVLHA